MTLRTSARRAATCTALAAVLAAMGTTAAHAAVVTRTDDTAADFNLGEKTGTAARADGSVGLAETLNESFATLPAWSQTPWAAGGAATVATPGTLSVDGALVKAGVGAAAGDSLEFNANFGTPALRHIGFGNTLNDDAWAIFSTDGATQPTGFYARTKSDTGDAINTPVTPGSHYRITRTAAGFTFYVDGALVATHAVAAATGMQVIASDSTVGDGAITIDDMTVHKTTGTFTSRVMDGTSQATSATFAATGDGGVTYEVRTGATPGTLGAWSPIVSGAAIPGAKRYVQYRATLATGDPAHPARIDRVDVAYTVDDVVPVTTIDAVDVSGTSATARFRSDDAASVLTCSLDSGAFKPCASPARFDGLAPGAHTVAVRATDAVGNVGTATKQFTVAAPQAPSGGKNNPPAPGPGAASDTTPPKVLMVGRSLDVSARGVAALKVRCPRSETSCTVKAKLRVGGRTVARRTLTLASGESRTFRLKLSRAARAALAKRSTLAATAVIAAVDAAGNRTTLRRAVTLHD